LENYPRDNPPAKPTDATAVVVKYVVEEVDRRVEKRLERERAALRATQTQNEREFLTRDERDRDMAAFLLAFSQPKQPEEGMGDSLLTLVKATRVCFPFMLFPASLSSVTPDFPRSRGGWVKFSGGPCFKKHPRDQPSGSLFSPRATHARHLAM
jgi:hypothetical protein